MLKALPILISSFILVASGAMLSACGQRGPLFLPTEAAAANRATLSQTLLPGERKAPPSAKIPLLESEQPAKK